jgi:hypothetical protein
MSNLPVGTWQDVFGKASPDVAAIAASLRSLILALHPKCVEVARPGDRAVSFGCGTRKMSEAYVYLMPQQHRVNLGFYQGAKLDDLGNSLEGSGKALRHVKVGSLDEAARPELRALIEAAIAERRATV